ncbi:MAG: methyltransferase [Candidatus Parvarchaeota archaeon]|nr:methyltransferase [Candidatus Parvarchaeota archaeon]MCW1295476.1 methyltransferase [Candidatus Parvarchaeum tengchongense]MCW1299466.1 methyltransferase [Candidatus Parvarchaeum tengchongense]MCW1312587.1 methyltransferase [Candidatus Parvarchaeum tengchongense]
MVDIKEFKDVYVPAEDSFLLLRAVKYAYGEVLDMFAGSGIIGLNAAKKSERVTFVDINPNAIKAIKYNAKMNGIKNFECILSDLFSSLDNRKFDVIYANPPYLPEKKESKWVRHALSGGKEGSELTINLIHSLKAHLKQGGNAFIILSSVYNTDKVYKEIKRLRLSFEKLSSINFFFEELILIKIYDESRNSGKSGQNYSSSNHKQLSSGTQSKKPKRS